MKSIIFLVGITFVIGITLKTIIDIPNKRTKESFYRYGGFPSIHTALVTSLSTSILLTEGFFSTHFAISLIFGSLIIRDLSIRDRIDKLGEKELKNYKDIHHRVSEILGGFILGISIPIFLFYLIP